MAVKTVDVPDIGKVQLTKRRGSRAIRLSITADGIVRVNMPTWVPYKTGLVFLNQKRDWVLKQLEGKNTQMHAGMQIGKKHRLTFVAANVDVPKVRTTDSEVIVRHPILLDTTNENVQAAAVRGSKKALQMEAEAYLPKRLEQVASITNLRYRSVSVRHLKSRWGSCSSKQHITLNYFLMLLPEELIDYVLIHELSHTKHMNHGRDFWLLVSKNLPNAKSLRKQLQSYQPSVFFNQA